MLHETEVVPRLVVAVALGAAVGLERQLRHKVVGLRTHALVSLACALVMGVSELLHNQVPLATGILTGVGFIGAGTIIRTEATVTGITTAATIWLTAALGVAVGAGFYLVALTATALALITLDLLERVERRAVREEAQRALQAQTQTVRQQAQVIDALTQTRPGSAPAPSAPPPGPDSLAPQHRPWWRRWPR